MPFYCIIHTIFFFNNNIIINSIPLLCFNARHVKNMWKNPTITILRIIEVKIISSINLNVIDEEIFNYTWRDNYALFLRTWIRSIFMNPNTLSFKIANYIKFNIKDFSWSINYISCKDCKILRNLDTQRSIFCNFALF